MVLPGLHQIAWSIDRSQGQLAKQIVDQIRLAIDKGTLRSGDRIAPSRKLAEELRLARGTVAQAIEQLIAEGLLETRAGSGTFVSEAATVAVEPTRPGIPIEIAPHAPLQAPDIDAANEAVIDLMPCRPSLEVFPLKAWRRCMADAAGALPSSDYGDPRGSQVLRGIVAAYLRRARGMAVDAEEVIITNGAVHAMSLLARLFLSSSDTAIVENPGYPLARQVLASCGASIHFCRVDEDGIVPDDLPRSSERARLIYTTPSHQFPIGSRLSLARRYELLDWVERSDALIIEDDYDGEFRFDVPPLPPMYSMAPQRVVYCGTFSKTMFPGLRVGFAVAPRAIVDAMADLRAVQEYAPAETVQLALSRFIADGEYERHILRMRRLYATKRKIVTEGLNQDATRVTGLESGLSALIEIERNIDARKLSEQLLTKGIAIPPLARYDFVGNLGRNALVLGYAEAPASKLSMAVETLAQAVQQAP